MAYLVFPVVGVRPLEVATPALAGCFSSYSRERETKQYHKGGLYARALRDRAACPVLPVPLVLPIAAVLPAISAV